MSEKITAVTVINGLMLIESIITAWRDAYGVEITTENIADYIEDQEAAVKALNDKYGID